VRGAGANAWTQAAQKRIVGHWCTEPDDHQRRRQGGHMQRAGRGTPSGERMGDLGGILAQRAERGRAADDREY
jgi:hypothetical protein